MEPGICPGHGCLGGAGLPREPAGWEAASSPDLALPGPCGHMYKRALGNGLIFSCPGGGSRAAVPLPWALWTRSHETPVQTPGSSASSFTRWAFVLGPRVSVKGEEGLPGS